MANAEQEQERLRSLYHGMGDGELEKLAQEGSELTDVARETLEEEIRNRGVAVEQPPAVVSAEPDIAQAVNRDGLVTIRRFRDLHDALLARGMIQSAGIECFIGDDNMVRLDWFISNLLGGVKLQVRQEDAEGASDILEQDIPEGFDVEGVGEYEQPRCPKCQSLDIGFEEFNKGVALTSAYVIAPVRFRREKWKCHSCGYEWHEEEGPAEATDR